MPSQKKFKLQFPLFIICVLLSACSHPGQRQQMAFVPPPTPTDGPPDLRPPQPAEVLETIKRIYGQAVTVETWRNQYFIAGDLNGDRSPDLAVVVRPTTEGLAELNHELANWIRCDPQAVTLPDPKQRVHHLPTTVKPVIIEQQDVLLAVVHGYGPAGWRDPQARQTYLLKNAIGSGMNVQPPTEAIKLIKKGDGPPPLLRGDVVKQTFAGEQGMLYYTGAKYAWHRLGSSRS